LFSVSFVCYTKKKGNNYDKKKIQEEIRVFFSKTNAQPFLLKSLQDKASYLLKEKRSMLFVPLKKPRRF